jgi:hypothetical protein
MVEKAAADSELRQMALANTMENFGRVFSRALEGFFIDRMDQHEETTAEFLNEDDSRKAVGGHLLKEVYEQIRAAGRRSRRGPHNHGLSKCTTSTRYFCNRGACESHFSGKRRIRVNYQELLSMNGEDCLSVSYDIRARMRVDDGGITIVYQSGNETRIPREMVEKAMRQLEAKGILTVDDVHLGITRKNGPRTNRLMAVLLKLPGVRSDKFPRVLYYDGRP